MDRLCVKPSTNIVVVSGIDIIGEIKIVNTVHEQIQTILNEKNRPMIEINRDIYGKLYGSCVIKEGQ